MREFLILAGLLLTFSSPQAVAQEGVPPEITLTADDRTDLGLIIYDGFAQVIDVRRATLPEGRLRVLFSDVSAKIDPESALFEGEGVQVIEKNFDFDVLSRTALLQRSIGRKVLLYRTNPKSGREEQVSAIVLAVSELDENSQYLGPQVDVVLQVGDRIEVLNEQDRTWRVAFEESVDGLVTRPTLSMMVEARGSSENLRLDYISDGVSWQADYVGVLSDDNTSLDFEGWATINNQSGVDFEDARLKLVAGEVKHSSARWKLSRLMLSMELMSMSRAGRPQSFADFYSIDLPGRTTIRNRQTKQIAFLSGENVSVTKSYAYFSHSTILFQTPPPTQPEPVDVMVEMQNEESTGLGKPLPKGLFRLYRRGPEGLEYIGDDAVPHTAVGEKIRVVYGKAFDVKAQPFVRDLRQSRAPGQGRTGQIFEAAIEVIFTNASDKEAQVQYVLLFQGNWDVSEANIAFEKEHARAAVWQVPVPAHGEARLTFKVRESEIY